MEGRILGRYQLLEEIGQGGMSVVYRGVDTTLQREVAIKILHPHLSRKKSNRHRFAREARAVARLQHDNILRIYDFSGAEGADAYIVTELVPGRTLAELLEDHGDLPLEVGALIVLVMFCLALLAPVAGRDPGAIDIVHRLQPPSLDYPLGTDDLGRDVLARILYGARISLLVGFVAVGIATFIGILLGAVAGFYGRWIDSLVMRFVDIMLCFPSFFLILAVIAFLEPSIWNIMIIIGLTSWMGVARLVRAEFL